MLRHILTASLGAMALIVPAMADCTRDSLKNATDLYIATQKSGQLSDMATATDGITYLENYKTANIKTGILSKPLKIDHDRSTYDTTTCASYTELIITDASHPYVIGTQIYFTNNVISKIDTIITDSGDWLFNAKNTLKWALTENWDTIPEAKRDTRATIKAAADAYCDIFHDKTVKVPWGTPCDRLEGGSYTGTGAATDSCNVGIPSGVQLTNRRYVIDETLGTVDVFLNFSSLPDTHEFRIEGGKIRYVHTMTVMN